MSTHELETKVKEYKELQRLTEELAAEMEAVKDTIKQHMDAERVEVLTTGQYKVTYKAVTSPVRERARGEIALNQDVGALVDVFAELRRVEKMTASTGLTARASTSIIGVIQSAKCLAEERVN